MECAAMEMHGSVTVGTKGQIVIPVEARKKLGIEEGDKLMVITKGDMAVGLVKVDDMQRMLEHLNQEIQKNA
jgi:AbrB family looped-hinge helix DNA binding protein